jgi:hypothetical protein
MGCWFTATLSGDVGCLVVSCAVVGGVWVRAHAPHIPAARMMMSLILLCIAFIFYGLEIVSAAKVVKIFFISSIFLLFCT